METLVLLMGTQVYGADGERKSASRWLALAPVYDLANLGFFVFLLLFLKGQIIVQIVKFYAQRAVALLFLNIRAENTRRLRMFFAAFSGISFFLHARVDYVAFSALTLPLRNPHITGILFAAFTFIKRPHKLIFNFSWMRK